MKRKYHVWSSWAISCNCILQSLKKVWFCSGRWSEALLVFHNSSWKTNWRLSRDKQSANVAEGNSVFALSYVILGRQIWMSNGLLFRQSKFKFSSMCVHIAGLRNNLENNWRCQFGMFLWRDILSGYCFMETNMRHRKTVFQEIEACPFSSLIFVSLLLADNALWYSFLQMYTFFGLCFLLCLVS